MDFEFTDGKHVFDTIPMAQTHGWPNYKNSVKKRTLKCGNPLQVQLVGKYKGENEHTTISEQCLLLRRVNVHLARGSQTKKVWTVAILFGQ